jgi:protein subunit release factor B
MPLFGVSAAKETKLLARMARCGIVESDLTEKFILGSGGGGQKQNKTASCVYLKHEPSSVEIKCQRVRSQAVNRYYARCELCERIEEKTLGEKSARRQKAEKIRRQKRRRTRRQKARMLEEKRKNSEKKQLRRKPGIPDMH